MEEEGGNWNGAKVREGGRAVKKELTSSGGGKPGAIKKRSQEESIKGRTPKRGALEKGDGGAVSWSLKKRGAARGGKQGAGLIRRK